MEQDRGKLTEKHTSLVNKEGVLNPVFIKTTCQRVSSSSSLKWRSYRVKDKSHFQEQIAKEAEPWVEECTGRLYSFLKGERNVYSNVGTGDAEVKVEEDFNWVTDDEYQAISTGTRTQKYKRKEVRIALGEPIGQGMCEAFENTVASDPQRDTYVLPCSPKERVGWKDFEKRLPWGMQGHLPRFGNVIDHWVLVVAPLKSQIAPEEKKDIWGIYELFLDNPGLKKVLWRRFGFGVPTVGNLTEKERAGFLGAIRSKGELGLDDMYRANPKRK